MPIELARLMNDPRELGGGDERELYLDKLSSEALELLILALKSPVWDDDIM